MINKDIATRIYSTVHASDETGTSDRYSHWATDFPAIKGEVVRQGDADYCANFGHATHRSDGVLSPFCPRCGDQTNELVPGVLLPSASLPDPLEDELFSPPPSNPYAWIDEVPATVDALATRDMEEVFTPTAYGLPSLNGDAFPYSNVSGYIPTGLDEKTIRVRLREDEVWELFDSISGVTLFKGSHYDVRLLFRTYKARVDLVRKAPGGAYVEDFPTIALDYDVAAN